MTFGSLNYELLCIIRKFQDLDFLFFARTRVKKEEEKSQFGDLSTLSTKGFPSKNGPRAKQGK